MRVLTKRFFYKKKGKDVESKIIESIQKIKDEFNSYKLFSNNGSFRTVFVIVVESQATNISSVSQTA